MTTGLITAALMLSTIAGPTQATMGTSAVTLADNSIASTNSTVTITGNDMASIEAAIDAASTSAMIANMSSMTSASGTTSDSVIISTKTQFTDNTGVMAYIKRIYANEPVLIDIARCESTFRQYNGATGGILHGKANTDDIGVMQINEKYQLTKALSLGYDIDTVEGNTAYAQYLYDTQGATPWKASESCWSVAYNNSQTANVLAEN
jgi:hypothetical protein